MNEKGGLEDLLTGQKAYKRIGWWDRLPEFLKWNFMDMVGIAVSILCAIVQAYAAVMVGRLSKKTSEATAEFTMNKTYDLAKQDRFLKYENDLNAILLEFFQSVNEIQGLEKRNTEAINRIRTEIEIKGAVISYLNFLNKFRIFADFSKLRDYEYVFLVNEDMAGTIWEDTWKNAEQNGLLNLRVKLYELRDMIYKLDSNLRDAQNYMHERAAVWRETGESEEENGAAENEYSNIIRRLETVEYSSQAVYKIYIECANALPVNSQAGKAIKYGRQFSDTL